MWAKHKKEAGEIITCPLCRTSWGDNAMYALRKEAASDNIMLEEED